MVVLVAALLRERMGWRGILGLLVSLFGVLLVITDGALASVFARQFNLGDLLMLGAIVVWSLYTIFGRGLKVPPITATAVQSTMIAVLLAPVALAGGASWPAQAPIAWALVYIVVFPSIGSYVLWNFAVKGIPAGRAGLYLNLITVFTVAIAIALGAQLTVPQVLGGLIVFAGVALSSLRPTRPAVATEPMDASPPITSAKKP
jgi:drug/metabolite transporter (DMT)-like permease